MTAFLAENWGSILVLAAVAAGAAAVVRSMVRRRKAGEFGCGCGCSNCPSKGTCHRDR